MNLKELERKLNDDEAFRRAFLSDPVGTLAAEGIELPEAAMKALPTLTEALRNGAKRVPGSTLLPAKEGIEISINISKDF